MATTNSTTGAMSGLLAGATLGGIGWGTVAAHTIGAPRDEAIADLLAPYLIAAGIITALCLYAAKTLWPEPTNTAGAVLRRQIAMALVTAPIGGWVYLLLQYLQHYGAR